MDIKEEIIEFCKKQGLDTIGFSECRIYHELNPYFEKRKNLGLENQFEEHSIDKKINPFFYMEEGKTIISIAFPYLYKSDFNESAKFSKYTPILSSKTTESEPNPEKRHTAAIHFVDSVL